jgi:hypothetical protein
MPANMAIDYRIYAVQGNHILVPALIIQCDCDEMATAKATAQFLEHHDLEISDGARLVKTYCIPTAAQPKVSAWACGQKTATPLGMRGLEARILMRRIEGQSPCSSRRRPRSQALHLFRIGDLIFRDNLAYGSVGGGRLYGTIIVRCAARPMSAGALA